MIDRAQSQIDVAILNELRRLVGQSLQSLQHAPPLARIGRQQTALLDNGAGQRFDEAALGHRHLQGLAAADVPRVILGDERQARAHARPRVRR